MCGIYELVIFKPHKIVPENRLNIGDVYFEQDFNLMHVF